MQRRLYLGGLVWAAATIGLVTFFFPVRAHTHFGHWSWELVKFTPVWEAALGDADEVLLLAEVSVGLAAGWAAWFVSGGEPRRPGR